MSEKIQATIAVTRRVWLTSIVEMPKADYDRLQAALRSGSLSQVKAAEKELNQKVDPRDWQDDELDDLLEFEEYKEEEGGDDV